MMRILLMILTMMLLAAAGAEAQSPAPDYRQRQADLETLSGVFGALHHIRRSCAPRVEADIWRERMKQLVDLEEPQPTARNAMVAAFNEAYRRAQAQFPYCDRRARDYAAASAARGELIVARLAQPLRDAMAQEGEGPFLWRNEQPQD